MLSTNDYNHLVYAAKSGSAVVEAPPFAVSAGLSDGTLVRVLPELPLPEVCMRALLVERRATTPLVRTVLDHLIDSVPIALAL